MRVSFSRGFKSHSFLSLKLSHSLFVCMVIVVVVVVFVLDILIFCFIFKSCPAVIAHLAFKLFITHNNYNYNKKGRCM